jgi:hypothetical protein
MPLITWMPNEKAMGRFSASGTNSLTDMARYFIPKALADAAANTFDLITRNPLLYPVVSDNQRRRALLPPPFNKPYAV